MDNIFIQKSIVMGIGAMTEDDLDLSDSSQMIEKPKAADNAELIEQYLQKGSSGNQHMDLRVKATCNGLGMALQWINEHGQENKSN